MPVKFIVWVGVWWVFLSNLYAQSNFIRYDSITVIADGDTMLNPFAGGLNFPQFSSVDIDNNGVQDVFVFDRSGNKLLFFLCESTDGELTYRYAPEFDTLFPELQNWVLLMDYNKDGHEDIFSSTADGGVLVYRNDYKTYTSLLFSKVSSLLTDTTQEPIYASPWDIPAISDIDYDGDIDILSFNISGSSVEYHRNISMETYGVPDSLIFVLESSCWGEFQEAFSNCDIYLNTSCKNGVVDSVPSANELHAGSTILAIDLDGDHDMEMLLGDLICDNITMLTNGGDSSNAFITSSDLSFPDSYPVNIDQFPAVFSIDSDNDGIRDLIAAPNAINISENYNGIWLYKNEGTNEVPAFNFVSSSFIQDQMIDVGEGANISFVDINNDSLVDMIFGNYGYHQNSADYISGLSYYENKGTLHEPSFELKSIDYAGISSLNLLSIYPCFGDIDSDGDEDMIIGESDGYIHLYTNKANLGEEADFILASPIYQNIDVGQYSSPQLVDVNRDNLIDLLIGERNGNINYYQNTGSVSNANFIFVTDSFGKINVCAEGAVSGYSVPFLVEIDTVGKYTLMVGSERGYIYKYENIDNNLEGVFLQVDSNFQNIWEGIRSTVSIADINNDGAMDLGVGNYRGGISLFKNSIVQDSTPIIDTSAFNISIYPNPAINVLNINIEGNKNNISNIKISITNPLGQLVYQNIFEPSDKITINTSAISNGLYHVECITGDYKINNKILFF